MSTEADTNPEAAGLRGKRAPKRTGPPAPVPGTTVLTQDPPLTAEPVTVFETMNDRKFVLFDPRERAAVIEVGGHVPEAELDSVYVRSEFDASETVIPTGCTTGVSRVLWQKGQHVRRDIYEDYVKRYRTEPAQ